MPATNLIESDRREVPTTPREAEALLQKWAEALREKGGASPLRLHWDRDVLILKVDFEALRKRQASIEFDESSLRLALKSRSFELPLRHFDAAVRWSNKWFLISVKQSPLESLRTAWAHATQRKLAEDLVLRLSEPADQVSMALFSRILKGVTEVTEGIKQDAAADALSADSNVLAILRVLEQPEVVENLKREDPLAPARLRGIEMRDKLVKLAGGTLSGDELAKGLGLTRQAVDKRRRGGRLLALSLGRRGYRYPAFQLKDGALLSGLEEVLAALKGHDAWTQLAFFVNRRVDLNEQTPIDFLRRDDREAVLRATATVGEHGAA